MKRKTYPLRINPEILEAVQKWANDDLRSVNAQIEFVLRESLIKAGRFKPQAPQSEAATIPEAGKG
ncbi:MAG TPA: Arc family DNA binding domain-containing protein [Gammaproteobacteria bacterium]|nr:Arc family DNA binding domain-containing protein [Gammaproteobacteria bacterium]HBP99258.1 Arc family DNA binding domain-containing protein [Gammaproteobacteria bacterium]|tara:strand:- start:966 stop:1163 length:198 start_codon:yes stop_codon:yes gene_type:complete